MQGGGGGVSVTNGKKVCIGVLSSDEIGLCGIEHDWVSTAVRVEENSKGELSYRRRNAGGEKCVLLGESADGACVSCMNWGNGQKGKGIDWVGLWGCAWVYVTDM